ncbi:hypothetical protein [Bosea sp. BIWAKO-01]|uniref:hypothetical protein n=1 Tax=Bosea sp. BIWAKO-01 TaxID=506668 RepID=UPI000853A442|nr:hypothetical protein [Bosea sp. BIWAKO-01]
MKGAVIGLAVVGVAWGGYSLVSRSMQRGTLPQKLQTGWFYAEGSCSRLLSHQGAFSFSMSEQTVEAIKSKGIDFFTDINDPKNQATRLYFYGEWKETPVPASFFSDGLPPNLHCGQEHSWLWPNGIPEALKRPGSFYQESGNTRRLFVLPELSLVVGSASDR